MNDFTGRRPTGRAKSFGRALLDGLDAIGTAMADGPKVERIKEIDAHIESLQHEKDSLIASLIEPGNLKVSDSYNPFDKSHPGCPYHGTQHIAHEFTLRD